VLELVESVIKEIERQYIFGRHTLAEKLLNQLVHVRRLSASADTDTNRCLVFCRVNAHTPRNTLTPKAGTRAGRRGRTNGPRRRGRSSRSVSRRARLEEVLAVIRDHSSLRLGVVGHTDSTGPADYNQGLSERRAQSVVDYLVSRGIDRDQLVASGKGETSPVATNETDDGRARNRRVEMVVLN